MTSIARPPQICLTPRLQGVGGMVSFQFKLASGLEKRGIRVTFDLDDPKSQAVLVIGGTRHIAALWRVRRRGVRIVQRLDGMNWLHRLKPQDGRSRLGLRHYLRAEYGNWLLALIRSRLVDGIVYQSEFSRSWWERVHRPAQVPNVVIHNGVDLSLYTPDGPHSRPDDCYRLLMVEGSLMGGYELGLGVAVQLAEGLQHLSRKQGGREIELMVAGRASEALKKEWNVRSQVPLRWAGLVPRDQIPELDRSAHLFYSADIHPACPNAVIEALACGLPVVAFETGALPELVPPRAGRVVPYGADSWRLEPPDLPALVQAGFEILQAQDQFCAAARQHASARFGLDAMVDRYIQFLLESDTKPNG